MTTSAFQRAVHIVARRRGIPIDEVWNHVATAEQEASMRSWARSGPRLESSASRGISDEVEALDRVIANGLAKTSYGLLTDGRTVAAGTAKNVAIPSTVRAMLNLRRLVLLGGTDENDDTTDEDTQNATGPKGEELRAPPPPTDVITLTAAPLAPPRPLGHAA